MSKLEDLGGEVAAWVVIPNEDNSSLIHHMGSKKGREFIKCKPDIDADLCDFLLIWRFTLVLIKINYGQIGEYSITCPMPT
jgi:hypothetical protein